MPWRRWVRGVLAVALLAAAAPEARAQSSKFQVWPGIDIWKRLSPDLRLYFPLTLSRDREVDYTEASVGVSVDYRLNVHFATRIGGSWSWSVGDTSYRELRAAGDLTYRFFPSAALVISDRNRFELRDLSGASSLRYRNRIRAERTFIQRNNHELTPYAMVELYYDTRYDAINRVRTDLGTEYRISPVVSVEGYLVYQHDNRADVTNVYALGLTLILNF